MSLNERKQQAAREHVVDAAAPLFVRDGYRSTTTRKVAEAAGVAEGTIFNLFGSKPKLLLAALHRSVPDPPAVSTWLNEARSLTEPRSVVALFCRTGTNVANAALPLVRVFLEAAAIDDLVASAWRDQEQFRFADQQWLLDVLAEGGWLRTDRNRDDLARDVWVIAAPETHLKCLDAGMTDELVEQWQHGALCALLIEAERAS